MASQIADHCRVGNVEQVVALKEPGEPQNAWAVDLSEASRPAQLDFQSSLGSLVVLEGADYGEYFSEVAHGVVLLVYAQKLVLLVRGEVADHEHTLEYAFLLVQQKSQVVIAAERGMQVLQVHYLCKYQLAERLRRLASRNCASRG